MKFNKNINDLTYMGKSIIDEKCPVCLKKNNEHSLSLKAKDDTPRGFAFITVNCSNCKITSFEKMNFVQFNNLIVLTEKINDG